MTDAKFCRFTVIGGYNTALLAAETWAVNISLALVFGAIDDEADFPTLDIEPATLTGSGTNVTTTSNWLAQGAPTFSFDPSSWLVDQGAVACNHFFQSDAFSSLMEVREMALYPIDSTGRAAGGRSAHGTFTTPLVGTGSSTLLPTEVSSCLSWQTPLIGRRGRGRIYLPGLPTEIVNDNSSVGTDYINLCTSSGATLCQDLVLDSISSSEPHVKPVVTGHPWTHYGVIKSLNMGNIFDAQRRRRRQLDEVRTSQSSGI